MKVMLMQSMIILSRLTAVLAEIGSEITRVKKFPSKGFLLAYIS